jgi:hypothetical protein
MYGKKIHAFPTFLQRKPVLKYTCTWIVPPKHNVIPYPTDKTHPTLMPDRETLSLRENCNMKK